MCFIRSCDTSKDSVFRLLNKTSFSWGIELLFNANLGKILFKQLCSIYGQLSNMALKLILLLQWIVKLPKNCYSSIIFKSIGTDISNLLLWLQKRTSIFLMKFLESSMSSLIKQIKKLLPYFVTNQLVQHITNFEKCRTKTVRVDPKYVEFPLLWS